jgi:hypothetical protein
MIDSIIRASLRNRGVVLLIATLFTAFGVYSYRNTPVDALPDLSDVQVIVRTPYPGQAPRLVEDQVTYPLTTALLSVPGATTVRGYSFYGDSFVNVLFEAGLSDRCEEHGLVQKSSIHRFSAASFTCSVSPLVRIIAHSMTLLGWRTFFLPVSGSTLTKPSRDRPGESTGDSTRLAPESHTGHR